MTAKEEDMMSIEGTWYNELGSTMTIDIVTNGQFTGSYQTAVSSSGCAQGVFPLVGQTDIDSGGQYVGFVVLWNNPQSNCNSGTAWSGQLQNINGAATITAFWLLTMEVPPTQEWASTLVGQDTFTQTQPKQEEIAAQSKLRRHSHP